MRTVVQTNEVFDAWQENRPARNGKGTLRTDGKTLWSYALIIGATRSDGQKFALNVGSSVYDKTFVGRTTASHARGASSVANRFSGGEWSSHYTVNPVPMTSPIAMQKEQWTIEVGWKNYMPNHSRADSYGYVWSAMAKRFPDGITIDFSMPDPDGLVFDPLAGYLPPHDEDVALAKELTQWQREALMAVYIQTNGGVPYVFNPAHNLSMLQLSERGLVDIVRIVPFDAATHACEVVTKPHGNTIARICAFL